MKKELSLAVEAVQAIVNNTVCPDPAYGGCIGGPIPGYGCINEAASFALRRLNEVEDTSSRPVDNEKSIWVLIREVEEAIAKYDKSKDHSRHAPSGDCIRCRLVKALEAP